MSILSLFNETERAEILREVVELGVEAFGQVLDQSLNKPERLTIDEAQERFKIGRKALMDLIDTGKIPYNKNGAKYLLDPVDLARYFDSTKMTNAVRRRSA